MTQTLSAKDYHHFCKMLEESSGIVLGDGKEYLVTSRLRHLMEQESINSVSELLTLLPQRIPLRSKIVDAMTTNETLWFRDDYPYRIFRDRLLPEMSACGQPLRIWSAACSTGQEPYSLSIEIEEFKQKSPGKLTGEQIIATDISPTALEQAKQGKYQALAIRRGMTDDYLQRYFSQSGDGQGVDESWQINPSVQQRITFKSQNLQQDFSSLGKFDLIYCRNVLIYFSRDSKSDIIRRMHERLKTGGYLILGSSESMIDVDRNFEMIQCHPGIIYRAK